MRPDPGLVTTAGSWLRTSGEARFTPRFPAVPGTEYLVLGRPADGEAPWRELARAGVPTIELVSHTVVEKIDPGVDVVPANLLRFAVTFSAQMDEGSAAGRILLLDESGAVMPGVLLEMPPELWDRDRRHLTVLLEPGRIKRGLQPNLLAGAPLREGGTVTLAVDPGIRDAEGARMLEGAQRTYRVGPPIRSRIDPTQWQVRWPHAESDALVVRFDRPLDRALVRRYLHVVDAEAHEVAGRAVLDEDARRWVFTPEADDRDFALRVDVRLEDLAGNSVRRVFDRDLRRSEDDGIGGAHVVLTPGD